VAARSVQSLQLFDEPSDILDRVRWSCGGQDRQRGREGLWGGCRGDWWEGKLSVADYPPATYVHVCDDTLLH
jgi:hypothetical protein